MGKAIPTQHPAVVLRSSFNTLRALLAVAMVAIVGLSAAIVFVATDDEPSSGTATATSVSSRGPSAVRYDGGPQEGVAASLIKRSAPATFDPDSIKRPADVRYDGGPEEGSRGIGR